MGWGASHGGWHGWRMLRWGREKCETLTAGSTISLVSTGPSIWRCGLPRCQAANAKTLFRESPRELGQSARCRRALYFWIWTFQLGLGLPVHWGLATKDGILQLQSIGSRQTEQVAARDQENQ